MRYRTSNAGARNLPDEEQDAICVFDFLKPGLERAALAVQGCRDVAEGIPSVDADWLAKRSAAITGEAILRPRKVLGFRIPSDHDSVVLCDASAQSNDACEKALSRIDDSSPFPELVRASASPRMARRATNESQCRIRKDAAEVD
ncbi:MAG: hypothetical protein ABI833_05305 [Acidobacteriota bacterium]